LIETREIVRHYKVKGKVVKALNGVSLKVDKGEIASLVGPNGAGKSTIVKILATLVAPTSGEAYVNGYSVKRQEREVRGSVGLVTVSDRLFYYRLTGKENLLFFASLYGLTLSEAKRRCDELLGAVGLSQWGDTLYMKYSTGMQRKLALARALIHDPPVLLLDEPTLGVDVVSSRSFRELIREVSKEKTVLFTSHYMREVEELSHKVYVIRDGHLIAQGAPSELVSSVEKFVRVKLPAEVPLGELRRYVVASTDSLLELKGPESELGGIMESALYAESVRPTLEDVYVSLVGVTDDYAKEGRFRGGGGRRFAE
jgi:ABC-2 type transport system ATP-binding protein